MNYTVIGEPDQVRETMRRTDVFAPTNALTSVVPLAPATLRVLSKVRFALPPVLASATGAQHRAVRSMVGRFFTPAKVAAIAPRVRELARERLKVTGAALEQGPVDLAESVARHIPPAVMADLTGQATPELGLLKQWSRDSLELFWGWPDPERQLVLAESAAEFYGWLRQEAEQARGTASLFGVLNAAGLSSAEVCSLGYFLVIAGQETTSLLANTALYRGLERARDGAAGGWELLGETGAATAHIKEVLSAESSVPTWRRTALHETEIAGMVIPAGAEILLELTGQHPEEAGPSAYSLAFGYGLHRCLGAKLAEMETAIILQETARVFPTLTLAGAAPEWLRLLSFQAPLTVLASNAHHPNSGGGVA